jgi:hypothetical protein
MGEGDGAEDAAKLGDRSVFHSVVGEYCSLSVPNNPMFDKKFLMLKRFAYFAFSIEYRRHGTGRCAPSRNRSRAVPRPSPRCSPLALSGV